MKKICILLFTISIFTLIYVSEATADYVSYFYTPGDDMMIFAPYEGTTMSIRDISDPSKIIWAGGPSSSGVGEIFQITLPPASPLPAGYYSVKSSEKISLLVGTPKNESETETRGYYALDAEGRPCGTKIYTYSRGEMYGGEPAIIVFSYHDNNHVKIIDRGISIDDPGGDGIMWQGMLNKGEHHLCGLYFANYREMIESEYPVSVLVIDKRFNITPASYSIPATSGNFSGNEFYTFAPGGKFYFFSFNDGTHIDLYDTLTGQEKGSWDLDKYKSSSYSIPSTDGEFYYTIRSTRPITALRRFDEQNNRGMHYIAERSGVLIGNDFAFDANPPVAIFAYKDDTSVEHQRPDGSVNSYALDAGEYATINFRTSGRILSDKAISVVSTGTVEATFVPIPDEIVDTDPWPPAVFKVWHSPMKPTTNDNSVRVRWATDELCTSCLFYRRNGGSWNKQCDSTFKIEHETTVNIAYFNADDRIEYYVSATDQSNYTTVNDNQGKYYTFTIGSYIPKLEVSRKVSEPPRWPREANNGVYTVTLTIRNTGTARAKNIKIEDSAQGLLPASENCAWVSRSGGWKLEIPVPDISPGGSEIVSYQLVPILYEHDVEYGIGYKDSTIRYQSPDGRGYSDTFRLPETLDQEIVYNSIKMKDYVILTDVGRLMGLFDIKNTDPNFAKNFNPENAGRILRQAAKFSIARNGVVSLGPYNKMKIEELIDSNWNGQLGNWNYLLFIGGTEIVPSQEMTFKKSYIFWTDCRKAVVADNTYADVKEGDNYMPELIVGRLPGDSPNDFIQQMENALSPIGSNKAVLISGTGDGTGEFVKNINDVSKLLYPYSTKNVIHWKDWSTESEREKSFMTNVPNADLIIYRDHGDVRSWGAEYSPVSTSNVTTANFNRKHPIVWSIACLTGNIRKDSLAEAFLKAGTSVFIGSTDLSARGWNNEFAKKLAVYHNHSQYGRSIGETFINAKRKLLQYSFTGWRLTQLVNEYNLYGDPKRGRPPESAENTRMLLSSSTEPQYGTPPGTIEITIPKFEVETEDGIDYVSIPTPDGGTNHIKHNEPLVPAYIHTAYIDAGYKIQNVTLRSRSGLETSSGLHLPLASLADDQSEEPEPVENGNGFFPKQDQIFAWRVFEELDGKQELVISILPFYYNKETTDVEFYREYVFDVEYIQSSVAIPKITVSQDETPPGQPVQATVFINNGAKQGLAVSVETEILDTNFEVVDVVEPVSVTIVPGETSVTVTWNSAGYEAGYYYFRETIRQDGKLLDTEAKKFRLGGYDAASVALDVSPSPEDGFEIGDSIDITARFQNTGAAALEGLATIAIRQDSTSETIKELFQELELSPGQTGQFQVNWDTTGMKEGQYTITTFLLYDGKATEPLSVTISTRTDIPISIQSEQDTYFPGEKVPVWVIFSDLFGEPLPGVTFSAEVIDPESKSSPLELSYYSANEFYAGWFFLPLSAPRGYYTIKVMAEHRGYRPTTATKKILLPLKTLELEVSKDQEAVDRIEETPITDVYPGDIFSYLITARNLYEQAVYLMFSDALDQYLNYIDGSLTVNGVTASGSSYSEGLLDYEYPELVKPGETLMFEFDVVVSDLAPLDWIIENTARIVAYDPLNPSNKVTVETNSVQNKIVPEASTLLLLGTGLLGLFALVRRRWNRGK